MNTFRIAASSLGLLVTLAGSAFGAPTLNEASQLLRSGQTDAAIQAFEAITTEDPQSDQAWAQLGNAYHAAQRYPDAVRANTRAAEFPRARPSALYNKACAQSLLGEKQAAAVSLQQALDAGFMDYDLIRADADLAGVRELVALEYPPAQTYTPFTGDNGVSMAYTVLLPRNYDAKREYPALFAFPPGGGGSANADWAIANLWNGVTAEQDWIVVVPVAPEDGWISHPAHHALEDMLDQILASYRIEGKAFHLSGFAEGARPACTYLQMSGSYFKTLSVASSYALARWDDDELTSFKLPVHFYVGSEDTPAVDEAQRAQRMMTGGKLGTITTYDGEGHLLPSLHGGAWLVAMDQTLARGKAR